MKRVPFEQAVEELVELYAGWTIPPEKWRLCDGGSLRLQGYDIAKDYDRCVLNTVIPLQDWPWELKGDYQGFLGVFMIPPKNSKELDEHCRFVERTGFGLATHLANIDLSQIPSIVHELPSGRQIYLQKPESIVVIYDMLIEEGLNWGEMQVKTHLELVQEIERIARQRREDALAGKCRELLSKHSM